MTTLLHELADISAQIVTRYTYSDGSQEARRDYHTKWVKKTELGRPVVAEVWGSPSEADMAAIRNCICPRKGKVLFHGNA